LKIESKNFIAHNRETGGPLKQATGQEESN
jgi:hypothetical protein